ncbi:family 20 glycosylhydrolase, partial [bacterium]|nr:family 20 glycosylhydrolase [bacterium]
MLDEIRPLAEYPGAHSFAINEQTYEFFDNCARELAAAFDSKYFHAGLDESWDLGYGKTEELVKQHGSAVVHAKHYQRLNEILKKYGKTLMMYSDVVLKYPKILELIPKDIILMYWKYEPQDYYPEVVQHVKKGFPLVVLPGMNNWGKIFPTISAAMVNIKNLTLEAERHNALGSLTSTWGDYGSKNLRELLYYGYAYQGEVAWSPETNDVSNFTRRFFTLWNGPGTHSYLLAIYELLEKWPSKWYEPIPDYFRHPFLPRQNGHIPTAQEFYRIYYNAQAALELIEQLRPVVEYRRGDLDYLRYCALSLQNYVQSQRLVKEMSAFDTKTASPEKLRQAVG